MDQSNELCIATLKGMFFGRHDGSYSFVENKEDIYFNGCDVRNFFEHELDKFVCAIYNDPEKKSIQLIDRSKKYILIRANYPVSMFQPFQLVPIAHFNPESLHFIFIRD